MKRYPLTLFIVLAALLITLAVPAAVGAQRDVPRGFNGPLLVGNDQIEVRSNERGQYTIGTRAGDPATADDDDRRLMYGHGALGFTSFSTLRVVENGQTRDIPLLQVVEPVEQDGGVSMTWDFDGLALTQTLVPANNPYTDRPDTVRITVALTNNTGRPLAAGLRIMLDTMIGSNDRAPFFVPGSGNFDTEREFTGNQVPVYWKAFEAEDYSVDSLKGQGILTGESATPPDRLVFATWPGIKDTSWDYEVHPELPVGDSAVAMYWEPDELAAGASTTWVTYYGLAGVGGGSAWIDAPVSITSAEPEFSATLWVANLSEADFTGGEARIILPEGLRLADDETELKPMPTVPVNGGAESVTWRLVGEGATDVTYPYSATVTFQTGSDPLSADAEVEYRFIAPAVVEPSPTPTETPAPVVAPVAPAPEEPERGFPWWLLLLPLLLLPLLLLLFRRRPSRPATRVAPPRAARSAPPPDFTERQAEAGPSGASVTHGRRKSDLRDPNENPMG